MAPRDIRLPDVLVKYNKKTVTVVTGDGQRWNVAPGLIRKAEPKDITLRDGKVISLK